MSQSSKYDATCFCGAVEFSVSGEPEAMAYCHCDSCRHWSAGPVNAFTLWKPDSVEFTRGVDLVAGYDKHAAENNEAGPSQRKWCKSCGGHLMIDHPGMGLVDIPAALVTGLDFAPGFHVHYQETVHRIKDGLPKFRDLPEPAGGSGEELAE